MPMMKNGSIPCRFSFSVLILFAFDNVPDHPAQEKQRNTEADDGYGDKGDRVLYRGDAVLRLPIQHENAKCEWTEDHEQIPRDLLL
ncbi:MAG: hypothetical protein K5695_09755 [Oscillospiraceae bacterium]|nr:hypothetical protein [Oscillospiraceae bacterium]